MFYRKEKNKVHAKPEDLGRFTGSETKHSPPSEIPRHGPPPLHPHLSLPLTRTITKETIPSPLRREPLPLLLFGSNPPLHLTGRSIKRLREESSRAAIVVRSIGGAAAVSLAIAAVVIGDGIVQASRHCFSFEGLEDAGRRRPTRFIYEFTVNVRKRVRVGVVDERGTHLAAN